LRILPAGIPHPALGTPRCLSQAGAAIAQADQPTFVAAVVSTALPVGGFTSVVWVQQRSVENGMSFRDGGQLAAARGPGKTPIAKTCKGLLVNNLVSNMFVSFVDASPG